jgi:hypothetical protein
MYQNGVKKANDHRVYQMVIKDTKIFHSKAFRNVPKWGFGLKINHLATLFSGHCSPPFKVMIY